MRRGRGAEGLGRLLLAFLRLGLLGLRRDHGLCHRLWLSNRLWLSHGLCHRLRLGHGRGRGHGLLRRGLGDGGLGSLAVVGLAADGVLELPHAAPQ